MLSNSKPNTNRNRVWSSLLRQRGGLVCCNSIRGCLLWGVLAWLAGGEIYLATVITFVKWLQNFNQIFLFKCFFLFFYSFVIYLWFTILLKLTSKLKRLDPRLPSQAKNLEVNNPYCCSKTSGKCPCWPKTCNPRFSHCFLLHADPQGVSDRSTSISNPA